VNSKDISKKPNDLQRLKVLCLPVVESYSITQTEEERGDSWKKWLYRYRAGMRGCNGSMSLPISINQIPNPQSSSAPPSPAPQRAKPAIFPSRLAVLEPSSTRGRSLTATLPSLRREKPPRPVGPKGRKDDKIVSWVGM
jgi:hypothetical protein